VRGLTHDTKANIDILYRDIKTGLRRYTFINGIDTSARETEYREWEPLLTADFGEYWDPEINAILHEIGNGQTVWDETDETYINLCGRYQIHPDRVYFVLEAIRNLEANGLSEYGEILKQP